MATDGQNDLPSDTPVEGTPPPVPEPPKEEPAKETRPEDNTKELLSELSGRVDTLAAQVAVLTDPGEQDSSPVKPPWTHRRVFGGK